MLIVVAHAGAPLLPHDALTAWHFDPLVVLGLAFAGGLYLRGHRPRRDGRRRAYAFGVGVTTVALALLSPIDRVAGILLSAHMVQHVLLVSVAAPLLAYAAPGAALLRGVPGRLRRLAMQSRRAVGVDVAVIKRLRHPIGRWLLFVATFWSWHASRLYGAAVDHDWLHAAEHITFLATAVLVWTAIVGPQRARGDDGAGIVVVFLLALQSVVLAALLTFSRTPWYEPYADPAVGWSLDPLADQHLAGVIMWVPSGLIHTAIGIALLARWFRELEVAGSEPHDAGQRDHEPVLRA